MRLGVDAFNLAADQRGMGRLVRHTLERLRQFDGVELFYIFRRAQHGAITPRDLARLRLDAVWYPWNALRFAPHAPSIVTVNDPFAFTYPHRNLVARLREQQPIRRAIREADRIFTISEWGAQELQRLFHAERDRLRVVLPVIDAFWRPAEPALEKPYVLFVAGPDARKNAAMLFEAYDAAFTSDGPELVVAGTLSEADEARFNAMRAARRRIVPSDEELRAWYSGARAVAVPSLAEGFGLPVVEAMACGAPVIASNATALPEAAGDAAVLIAPDDPAAWSLALRDVAGNDGLRAELRERGFARIRAMDPDGPATALLESVRQLRANAR